MDGFDIDISGCARPGENRLRIDVTKPGYHAQDRFPLRQVLSGFVPDVLCTFGGLWDDVALERADASSWMRTAPRATCAARSAWTAMWTRASRAA